MFGFAIFYFVIIQSISQFKNTKREQSKFYDELNEVETNYFSRLTKSEKNKWVALEYYRRKHMKIKLLKDDVL